MKLDYLIVGGGTAGCVLANRLSANPAHRVALVEAGPDIPPDHTPQSIYQDGHLPDYFSANRYWTGVEAFMAPVGNRSMAELATTETAKRYEQAKVMGGGSSVNGQIAMRGLPVDFDDWQAQGATGWSFDDVLPYFKKLERDLDFAGPFHGRDGPIPIRRTFPSEWGGLALAVRDELVRRGLPYHDDAHAFFGDGCFPHTRNNVYGHRVSAATGYLDGITRTRKNLEILDRAHVDALLIEKSRAVGARIQRGNDTTVIRAQETVVCAGTLHSPALLMRAGVGPGDELRTLGVSVVHDSPGVGENLQDHPMCGIGLYLNPEGRVSPTLRNSNLLTSRWSSGAPGCATQDMKLSVTNRFGLTNVGAHFGTVQYGPFKAYSRGKVTLRSTDANDEPFVSFNLLSDSRDLSRMIDATRFAYDVLNSPPVRNMVDVMFAGVFGNLMRSLHVKGRFSEVFTRVGAKVLDLGGLPRKLALRFVVDRRFDIHELMTDERKLEEWIRFGVQGDWHACGTCAIGAKDNRFAVVDPRARVYGVENLRVVDASIMPSIPTANTALTTFMVAEKAADMIIEDGRTR